MKPAVLALARGGDHLTHAVSIAHRAPKHSGDKMPLIWIEWFGITNDHFKFGRSQLLLRSKQSQTEKGGSIAPKINNASLFQRTKVAGTGFRRQVVGRQIELVQSGIPDPEGRLFLGHRRDHLPS